MGVPAFRTSPARRDKRRSHLALKATQSVTCANCGEPKRPHAACAHCGFVRPGLQLKTRKED